MSNFREIAKGAAVYASGSIFGPLLIFGGIGWVLDKKFETGPMWLLIFIGIAFLITNFLLFKHVQKITRMMDELGSKNKDKKES